MKITNRYCRKVIRSDGIIFNSATEAAGTHMNKIAAVCNGKRKRTLGYGWQYYEESNEIYGEEWKLHPYKELAVSNIGRVKYKSGHITFGSLVEGDCHYPMAHHDRIHRLVAETWISLQPTGKPFVNHKDGDKSNNFVYNLEWCSQADNHLHSLIFKKFKLKTLDIVDMNNKLNMVF